MTAVEWLMEQINQKDNLNSIRLGGTKALNQLFEQAKQMEAKQIISFADQFAAEYIGFSRVTSDSKTTTAAEEYYNKVIKQRQ